MTAMEKKKKKIFQEQTEKSFGSKVLMTENEDFHVLKVMERGGRERTSGGFEGRQYTFTRRDTHEWLLLT